MRILRESGTATLPVDAPNAKLIEAGVVELREAPGSEGTYDICIATPGWGSSGYYSESVLKEGAAVFQEGLHQYWDHPAMIDRPERSLRDLAGVLVKEAVWKDQGWNGPGLYAESKVFSPFAATLEEIKEHIGISMRAYGTSHFGEAEGESGEIIDEIKAAASVDFVTLPGRGGKIRTIFESALPGNRSGKTGTKEEQMDELQEARRQLTERDSRIRDLEESNKTLATEKAEVEKERDELRQENARHAEALILREAKDHVAEALGKVQGLPDITKKRLQEALSVNPPTKDGKLDDAALTVKITEAVKNEAEYLKGILGKDAGKVIGMGATEGTNVVEAGSEDPDADYDKSLTEAFKSGFGLDEKTAAIAGGGRN